MKIYDFVELINSLEYLEEKGIFKESKGTIIKLENNIASVLFFNEKNMGDYAVANVNTKFLKTIGEFPTGELINLNNFIKNLDQEKHDKLKYPNIKEYDLVELLSEDEKYSKFGVHKGNKGVSFQITPYKIKWK